MSRPSRPPLVGRGHRVWYLIFVTPWILGLTLFHVGPLLVNLALSLTHYDGAGIPYWLGLQHYGELQADAVFRAGLVLSALYQVSVPGAGLLIGLVLVAFFTGNGERSGSGLPIWGWGVPAIFAGGTAGALILLPLLARPVPAALYWVLGLWGVGGSAILIRRRLAQIPDPLLDAARLEGADGWRATIRLFWPMLTPFLFALWVTGLLGAYQLFAPLYLLSEGGGGPGGQALFHPLYFYMVAFRQRRFGYASAQAVVLAAACLLVVLLLAYWVRRHPTAVQPWDEEGWL